MKEINDARPGDIKDVTRASKTKYAIPPYPRALLPGKVGRSPRDGIGRPFLLHEIHL